MRFTVFLPPLCFFLSACSGGGDPTALPEPRDMSVPPPPTPPAGDTAPILETTSIQGRELVPLNAQLSASGPDQSTITFTLIEGPTWLQLAENGAVSGTPDGSAIGTRQITVQATHGTASAQAQISLEIAYDPIEEALRRGDHTLIIEESETTPPAVLLDYLQQNSGTADADIAEIMAALDFIVSGIEGNTLTYDLSLCASRLICEENPAFSTEIHDRLHLLRNWVKAKEVAKIDPFDAPNETRLFALLSLTSDYYRSMTDYPMPVETTSTRDIIRALLAEMTVVTFRKTTPAQPDLGTFSRSDFRPGLNRAAQVTLLSRPPFRTTGVYAFPGETVTVTRLDASTQRVRLRVNSLRDQSGAPFRNANGTGYNRPVFLSSAQMEIRAGETLQFTSPYGGPIHAYFDTADDTIELQFGNVGLHPVWRGPEDNDAFMFALATDEYDWAELVTPNFEVHSTADKMRQTMALSYYDTPADLADATQAYMRHWSHWLAGLEGDGIDDNPDLQTFANTHGLSISEANRVKHMNAEQSTCGWGCSGNPYDAFWKFDPIFLGDLHELGHGLEFRSWHHFEGGDATHSTTNMYAFHAQYRYYSEHGRLPTDCSGLPHKSLFETIQKSLNQPDPGVYMRGQDLTAWTQQSAIFIQLTAALQTQGVFTDGWFFWPRFNSVTREYRSTKSNTWSAKRAGLGFGDMSYEAAQALSQNDWLLIAMSWAAQRDLTDYLEMWGYAYSSAALQHLTGLNLPRLEPAYYAIPTSGACFGLEYNELPLDGASDWPLGTFKPQPLAFASYDFMHTHTDQCQPPAEDLSALEASFGP
ncbi:MAG: ImpA family metalloprotease [Pseudomonadota bacterium]